VSVSFSQPELVAAAIGALLVAFLWSLREFRFWKKIRQLNLESEQQQLAYENLARQREGLRLRREKLIERYGSIEVVDYIVSGRIWQGMSSEQLVEALGQPEDIDQKVFKTKVSQTWKYDEVGKNRFSRRVFIENDVVVGWQEQ
jgi:hypothetical protein